MLVEDLKRNCHIHVHLKEKCNFMATHTIDRTDKWLFSCVQALVCFQLSTLTEGFSTTRKITGIWSLTFV